jgi:hypothetical protein
MIRDGVMSGKRPVMASFKLVCAPKTLYFAIALLTTTFPSTSEARKVKA